MLYRFLHPQGEMAELSQLLADLSSGKDSLAEKAVEQIIALGKDGIPGLLNLRESKDEDTRWWAYCALGQLQDADVNWFISGLKDPSPEVRESSAMALCHTSHPKATLPLISALSDSDRMVTTLAGNALIGIGKEATLDLIKIMEEGSPPAKIEAARALAEIKDTRAIPALMAGSENGSEMVKFWSNQGLENLGVGMVYFTPGN
jgi:HEAT repeat protein